MPAIFTYVLLWFYVVFPVFPSFSARANRHAQSFFSSVTPANRLTTICSAHLGTGHYLSPGKRGAGGGELGAEDLRVKTVKFS